MLGIQKIYDKFKCAPESFRVLVISILFFAGASSASAQANSSTAALTTTVESPKSAFGVDGKLVIDTARSLDVNSEPSWSGEYVANLNVKHKSTGIAADFEIAYAREYSYQRDDGTDGDLHHATVSLSKGYEVSSFIDHVGLSLGGALPVNRDSARRTFRGSIGPGIGVDKKLGAVTLAESIGYKRGIYEYDIRDDGVVNSPDSYKSKSDISFEINDQWSVLAEYVLTYLVSFQGVVRSADTTVFEVDYQPTKTLGFALGLITDRASQLDPDGQTSKVKFFDNENASGYFDMILSF